MLLCIWFGSCAERDLVFVEVTHTDRSSPQGEVLLALRALVSGAESPDVRVYISLRTEALADERVTDCLPVSLFSRSSRSPFNLESIEGEETEVEDARECYFSELRQHSEVAIGGSLFEGEINLGPKNIGGTFSVRLRARDGEQTTWWPREGAQRWTVEGLNSVLSISHIAPRVGPSNGGTALLIRGEGFADSGDLALWLGQEEMTNVVVESPQLISAVTPLGPPNEIVKLRIRSAGRLADLDEAFRFNPPPQIERLIPEDIPLNTERSMMLLGQNFVLGEDGSQVYEELTSSSNELIPVTIIHRHDTEHIEVLLSSLETSASKLIVVNPDQQRAEINLVRQPAPQLLGVNPTSGPDDQPTWILLDGQNLRIPATVWFDGRKDLGVEVSNDGRKARVKTPLHPGGLSDIIWYNPDGQNDRLAESYRFRGAPRVNDAEPLIISRCGGGITTLIGLNFSLQMNVYFNGILGEVLEVSEDGTTATVKAPSAVNEMGDIDLVVVGVDGRQNRQISLLSYGVQPLVRTVVPSTAPIWGGTRALLSGSDLDVGSLFTVGDRLVERSTFINDGCDSLVEIVIPEGVGEDIPLSVEALSGQFSVLPAAIDYIAPEFTPPEGLSGGFTNLRLTGLDLRAGLLVLFNGQPPRAITQVSDEEWKVLTANTDPGVVEIEIRNTDGRGITSAELYRSRQFSDQGAESLNAVGDCNHISQGDFNGDGLKDIILAMGSSSPVGQVSQRDLLYFGTMSGLGPRIPSDLSGNGMNVYSADIDGDQDLDLLMINLFSERNFLYLNDGLGNFREDPLFPSMDIGPSYDAGIFDVDGDGQVDLFFMQTGDTIDNQTFGPERILLRDNSTWIERSTQIDFNLDDVHDHDMIHGDLNEDGLDDVIIVVDNLPQSFPGNSNRILLNQGNGRFERISSPINNYPGDWLDVALADINSDGHLDILMPQDYIEGISVGGTPSLAIFVGDGQGGFVDESFRAAALPRSPAFGVTPVDLDLDGDLDLLVAIYGLSFGDGSIEPFQSVLLLNDGNGVFFGGNSSFNQVPFIPSTHFEVIDLDQDGRFDIVECAAESQSRVWLNE